MKKGIYLLTLASLMLIIGFTVSADTIQSPANLQAVPISPTSIGLYWSASTGAAGYEIFRNSTSSPIATTTATAFTNSGLTPSTTYTYYVTARDASNTVSAFIGGVATTTMDDVTAPSVPGNPMAVPASSTQINFSWTVSTDYVGVAGYVVYREGSAIATTTASTYPDTGLSSTTVYSYQVLAFDAAGNYSGLSSIATATPQSDVTAPTVPTGLGATAASKSQINLSWNPSYDLVGVTGYKVYRNGSFLLDVAANSYHNTGLSASTSYNYYVSAYDAAGNISGTSTTVYRTTLSEDQTPTTTLAKIAFMGYSEKNKKAKLINLRSNEIIKIVVYSSSSLDATAINPDTAYFGGAKSISMKIKDINRDGLQDMVFSFRAKQMKDLSNSDTYAIFNATAKDGSVVAAQLAVRVKGSIKKKSVYKELHKKFFQTEKQNSQVKKQTSSMENKIQNQVKKLEDKKIQTTNKINQKIEKMDNKAVKVKAKPVKSNGAGKKK